MREQALGLPSSEGPCRLLAETASSNSVSRLPGRAHTSFHANALGFSHGGPASALAHLINPHGNKGKQRRPSMRRPALPCCWHGVCGRWTTGRKEGASFAEGNCAGAKRCAFVIGWFFFPPLLFFLLLLFLPPQLVWICLPSGWNYFDREVVAVQTNTNMSTLGSSGHWHSQAIYPPAGCLSHGQAQKKIMTLDTAGSL